MPGRVELDSKKYTPPLFLTNVNGLRGLVPGFVEGTVFPDSREAPLLENLVRV